MPVPPVTKSSMPVVRVGVGAVVRREGSPNILLGLRLGSHGAGTWALPGGHLEVGESFEGCAMRELAEETGISTVTKVRVLPFTSNDIMPLDGKHYVTVFVALTVAADATVSLMETSHTEWRWIAMDQMPGPIFAPFQALLNSGVLTA